MHNIRRGFTMIELIFVIVIIGILAAVAIPKLAANRDDTTASICASEFGNLVTEVLTNYSRLGYTEFRKIKIQDFTNLQTSVALGSSQSGIHNPGTQLVSHNIQYNCEGERMAGIEFQTNATTKKYEIIIYRPSAVASIPANIKAKKIVEKNYNLFNNRMAYITL